MLFIYSDPQKQKYRTSLSPILRRTHKSSPKRKRASFAEHRDVIITGESQTSKGTSIARVARDGYEITKVVQPSTESKSRGIKAFEEQLTMRENWEMPVDYNEDWITMPEVLRHKNCPEL